VKAFSTIVPADADASAVSDAIVEVVDMPFGKRPFRVHIDPTQHGTDVAFGVIERVRTEMLHRSDFPTCFIHATTSEVSGRPRHTLAGLILRCHSASAASPH
jgi:hypothetical protein